MFHVTRRAALGSGLSALAIAGCATSASGGAAVPQATLLPGQPTLPLGAFDPAVTGHSVEEYIVAGTATSYRAIGEPDAAGRWTVEAVDTAPYVTRIVAIRPTDAQRFNGSVVLEWLNVSGGLDVGPVWSVTRRELVRNGSAYVALSAQRIGIEGGAGALGVNGQGLKQVNPERYGRLNHPGDKYSYDIFSQVGALIKNRRAGILGGLVPRHVIGVGESQSAGYLTTYANAVDPLARVFDGFLIYSRSGGSALLEPRPPTPGATPPPQAPVRMRDDLRVPTLTFITETDLLRGYHRARQPDTDKLRTWEVPGTAHADAYFIRGGAIDTGSASSAELAAAFAATNDLRGARLAKPYNNAPQHHYMMQAAMAHLQRWLAAGAPPPHGEPIQLTGSGQADDPVRPVLDEQGNARGGIRSPWMDAPTSVLAGVGNSGSPSASLYGTAEPFDAAQLARLYPGGRADYVRRFEAALDASIRAGFILAADRAEILGLAAASYPA